jgi:hypothetical protein
MNTLRRTALCLTAGSLLVLTACGSDAKIGVPAQKPITTTASGNTSAGGGGSMTTNPGTASGGGSGTGSGSSADCLKLATEWSKAVGAAASGQGGDGNVFAGLEAVVPDSLKADAKVLAAAYTKYMDIFKKYNGDVAKAMSDPAVQEALKGIGSPEVQASQKKISDYFDGQCKNP